MSTIIKLVSRGTIYFTAGLLLSFFLFKLAPDLHLYSSLAASRFSIRHAPTITTQFEHFGRLEDLGPAGDVLWDSLLPQQGGMLWVATNSTENSSEREGWGISMFHAVHCLQMMREVFKSVVPENHPSHSAHSHPRRLPRSGPHEHDMDPRHAVHCFSYLYQVCNSSITCQCATVLCL